MNKNKVIRALIKNHRVDRDLDERVAIEVFNWTRVEGPYSVLMPPENSPMYTWAAEWDKEGRPHWLPYYSSDMDDAWEVMIALWKFNDDYEIWYDHNEAGEQGYTIVLYNQDDYKWSQAFDTDICKAICKAAINMAWWRSKFKEAKENGTYIRPGWTITGESPYG